MIVDMAGWRRLRLVESAISRRETGGADNGSRPCGVGDFAWRGRASADLLPRSAVCARVIAKSRRPTKQVCATPTEE